MTSVYYPTNIYIVAMDIQGTIIFVCNDHGSNVDNLMDTFDRCVGDSILFFFHNQINQLLILFFCLSGTTSTVYAVIAQYTFLSRIHPGNRNWVEILGIIVVVISATVPAYKRAKHKQRDKNKQNNDVKNNPEEDQPDGNMQVPEEALLMDTLNNA